ncbi:urease accessory [Babesia ovis]|uniref:Urease accessory n=1 Tax=Babesia ovis TaxID=5869 RepID=A0A9W5T7P7_BABOV|nr:urease accessory [Babesia ovis]
MRAQRCLLLSYFGVMLAAFYALYFYIVRGLRPSVSLYSAERYLGEVPKPFTTICDIYYDTTGIVSTENIAKAVSQRLLVNGVTSEALPIEHYRYAKQIQEDPSFIEPIRELLDLSSPFTVLLRYADDPPLDADFDVVVHGGKLLVFALTGRALNSVNIEAKVYDLIQGVFFRYEGMPSTNMTPLLDLSFILMSDDRKVDWNASDDIVTDVFHPIANAMSLFYDISIHSRVISGANFSGTMNLNNANALDLQDQPFTFFDFLDRVTNVEVATKDSGIYRHSIAFICHIPNQEIHFYDRALRRETDSVMLKGTGVLSFLNVKDETSGHYSLSRSDIETLAGSWVTHIRKMHNLPPSPVEMVANSLDVRDKVKVLEDGHYLVMSPDITFKMRLSSPGLVAFYGFEVPKIAKSLYHLYLKGAIDTLNKAVKPLATLSFMTMISPSAINNMKESHRALSCLYTTTCDGKPQNNMEALALARTAFNQSLEAISDDETYAKNAVSFEHGLAYLMCDAFPFLFPMVANTVKYITDR